MGPVGSVAKGEAEVSESTRKDSLSHRGYLKAGYQAIVTRFWVTTKISAVFQFVPDIQTFTIHPHTIDSLLGSNFCRLIIKIKKIS